MLSCLQEPMNAPAHRTGLSRVAFCEVKHRLMDAFIAAVREINAIENQQVEAVLDCDPDFSRFDLLLHFALEKKDTAKYALMAHAESHNC